MEVPHSTKFYIHDYSQKCKKKYISKTCDALNLKRNLQNGNSLGRIDTKTTPSSQVIENQSCSQTLVRCEKLENREHFNPKEKCITREKHLEASSSFEELFTQLITPQCSQETVTPPNESDENLSFDKAITRLFAYSQNDKRCIESNNNSFNGNVSLYSEIGTQTSFDESSIYTIHKTISKNIFETDEEPLTQPEFILQSLKNCNFIKIGTEEWLLRAISDFGETYNWVKSKKRTVILTKIYNCTNLGTKKYRVRRLRNGKEKIYILNSNSSFNENLCDSDSDYSSSLSEVEQKLNQGFNKISKNDDFVYGYEPPPLVDKSRVKKAILELFSKVADALELETLPFFQISRADYKNCKFSNGRLKLKSYVETKKKLIRYSAAGTQRKFCIMLYIMAKAYQLISDNSTLTKRELYYQIKRSVNNAEQVNVAIREVTRLLNVGDWHLNIVAQSGLVYGELKLVWASGNVTNCNETATIIPHNIDDIIELKSTAHFILVIEKESIFRKLLEEDLPKKLGRPFVMITGRGVPDYNTQLFLNKLSRSMAIPVFILVDADVYGIRIMLNYRFGSLASCHLADYLSVPNARWIGVFPSEISKLGIKHSPITKAREKSALKNLIESPYVENHPKLLEQLNIIKCTNRKASIEGLIKNNTFLSESYLPTKFFNQDFI